MTTLHFNKDEISGTTMGEDGSLTVELTEAGERSLVAAAVRHQGVLDSKAVQREAYLRGLSNDELLHLARQRFGGPEPDVAAEAMRRMRLAFERLRPALEAMRGAGLISAG